MNAALFGNPFDPEFFPAMKTILEKLNESGARVWLLKSFKVFLGSRMPDLVKDCSEFEGRESIPPKLDFLLSIGGDGTFLEAAALTRGLDIPLVGINSGRLGFLAYISRENVVQSMEHIFNRNYRIEERSLIEMSSSDGAINDVALNEIAIQKTDSKLITIHLYLDGELLNSYWADGLIIATPTGSTAYSLSVGGPIVTPGSENFIISPISPHTLAVRPVVIPNTHDIRLKIDGRTSEYIASVDYRSYHLDSTVEVNLKKSKETVKMLKLSGYSYYGTIREKLMWGIDKRNW